MAKRHKHHKKQGVAIILFGIVAGLILFWIAGGKGYFEKKAMAPKPDTITAIFDCDEGKSVVAAFSGQIVDLTLSDGRQMVLNQAISADGARYANPDETFVFWNKGNTAFIQEGKDLNTTYNNCVEK